MATLSTWESANALFSAAIECLEESPSIALTPDLRAEMGTVAVRIAKDAGYINAGHVGVHAR